MRRFFSGTLLALITAVAACNEGVTDPEPSDGGVDFGLTGTGAHVAVGSPALDGSGSVLHDEFAIARPDSVGGFAVISFEPTGENTGNLFVLQAPRQLGTHTCSMAGEPCHGRLIMGVHNLSTVTAERFFHVTEGSLTITEIGPDRLKGTFSITLTAHDDEPDNTIVVENGTIDVPWFDSQVTDGSLACLLSLVGLGTGNCRA